MSDATQRRADALAVARVLQLTTTGPSRFLAESVAAMIGGLGDQVTGQQLDRLVADLSALLARSEADRYEGLVAVHKRLLRLLRAGAPAQPRRRLPWRWRPEPVIGADPDDDLRDPATVHSEQALLRVAEAYGDDAVRRGRLGIAVGVLALAIAVAATVIGLDAVDRVTRSSRVDASALATSLLLPAILFAAAALVGRQAAVIRRGAHELQRLERQFQAVTAYLEPLPVDARNLMRAALAQRLFPRLIEDDPLRDDDWFPKGAALIDVIRTSPPES